MNPLTVDPKTGFLQSVAPNVPTFDAARKSRAIEIAKEMISRGEWPKQELVAKALGITFRTLSSHLTNDPVFKKTWDVEVVERIEDELVGEMYAQGRKPSGYMDRITLLRAYRPAKWAPDKKVQITSDSSSHKNVLEAIPVTIDAEIIENTPIISTRTESVDNQLDSNLGKSNNNP